MHYNFVLHTGGTSPAGVRAASAAKGAEAEAEEKRVRKRVKGLLPGNGLSVRRSCRRECVVLLKAFIF
jgi:hypothetical protein